MTVFDEKNLELLRKTTKDSYASEKAKAKTAVLDAVTRDNFQAFQKREGRAAVRNGDDEGDESDDDDPDVFIDGKSRVAQSIPKAQKAEAYAKEANLYGKGNMTYKDGKGIKHKTLPKFCKKYQIQVLPKGFYFEHIICDKTHAIRNPRTSWSRLIRAIIELAHRYRTDREGTSTLLLVSATPAINDISDYRWLRSLF